MNRYRCICFPGALWDAVGREAGNGTWSVETLCSAAQGRFEDKSISMAQVYDLDFPASPAVQFVNMFSTHTAVGCLSNGQMCCESILHSFQDS